MAQARTNYVVVVIFDAYETSCYEFHTKKEAEAAYNREIKSNRDVIIARVMHRA